MSYQRGGSAQGYSQSFNRPRGGGNNGPRSNFGGQGQWKNNNQRSGGYPPRGPKQENRASKYHRKLYT